MKNLTILLIAFCVVGCTKETYIEGLVPVTKSFDLNKTMPVINGQTSSCKLKIEGTDYLVNFTFSRYKATTSNAYYGVVASDSVIFVTINSQLPIETKTYTVNKYHIGDLTNSSATYANSNVPLFEAVKKSPYTSGYHTVSKIGTSTLNFGINEEGYFAFSFKKAALPIFGWIHINIDDKNILCEKYGYQTFEAVKAGQE